MWAADGRESFAMSLRAAFPVAVLLIFTALGGSFAQPSGCSLVDDPHNPSEKILRCGDDLAVRPARGTRYKLTTPEGQSLPTGAELDSGALMIEGRKPFQILTPHAIAAVRGTKWAVEVKAKQSSTFVVSGSVEVRRRAGKRTVELTAGEGVDVSGGRGPLEVKRWKKKSRRCSPASVSNLRRGARMRRRRRQPTKRKCAPIASQPISLFPR